METCNFCGLEHDCVEGHGVLHCPNRACIGPGTTWFRMSLKSFKKAENSGGIDSFDPEELIKVIRENPWGIILLDKTEESLLEYWKTPKGFGWIPPKIEESEILLEVGILSDGTPLYSKDNGAGGQFYLDCDGAIVFNSNDGLEKLSMILMDMVRNRK